MNLINVLKDKINEIEEDAFERGIEHEFYDKLSKELAQNREFVTIRTGAILCAILGINSDVKFEHIYFLFQEKTPFFTNDYQEEDVLILLDIIWALRDNKFLFDILSDNEDLANTYLKLSKVADLEERKEINAIIKRYKKVGLELFESYKDLKIFTKIVKDKIEHIAKTYNQYLNYKHNYFFIQSTKGKNFKQILKELDIDDEKIKCLEMVELNHFFKQLSEKNFELTKLKKSFNSSNQKKKIICEKTIQYLESLDEANSIDIPNDILNKLDDDLLIELLKLVLNTDRKIYNELQIENIKKIHYNEVETKFLQNNIDINKLPIKEKNILINNIKVDTLDKILIYLNKNEWKWLKKHPNFVQILLNTNELVFNSMTYWLNNRIISMETIYKNIGILLENNNIAVNDLDVIACYNKVKTNINLLSKVTELNNKTYKNGDILFMDTNVLKILIELIKKYKLDLKNENSKSYCLDILLDYTKFDDLDSFIELGFKDYITNNCQNLNVDSKDIISRLSIFVNTGLDPFALEDRLLSSIVTGKNFFIPNEQLSQFNLVNVDDCFENECFDILKNNNRLTISKSTLDLDIVKYLDNLHKVSELEYNFDNIVISRIKFLRNMECLIKNKIDFSKEMVMSSLTYKSPLDQDTTRYIEQVLCEFNGIQKRK